MTNVLRSFSTSNIIIRNGNKDNKSSCTYLFLNLNTKINTTFNLVPNINRKSQQHSLKISIVMDPANVPIKSLMSSAGNHIEWHQ
jgi:hypothetical protein